ncbi:MAG: general secretion pathway protein GspJ [Mesorhizobium sp.]|uniref:general secretion pathway protein GspJ n=1 Tax=Mesorhizobium sp. TaxID=1871066 RepID=UPI000FE5B535|nr:general secretion pathway protein GspJ [Mesorhizobium sp.]RWD47035.1 MAG: general secretion pathway protein GspJ [Mesorhizobium sp.]RWE52179.1 MAG: general secretion pathway protein GspJ [Mesorhizobium sp.]RWF11059.1 MAG: general secretion pathway protein GspJ [Mesorhizobium sp.]RWF20869.1 MAG: general secretion pathway protein GspJ [Mesorhizobium sp.]
MSRPKPSASVEGFALIDVLVGLALVGVISSLMIVFLGQARTMMRIQTTTEMQIEADAASRFLETAISGAEPLPLSKSSPENVVYLSGDSARIEFNGVQAIGFRSSALREIAISLGSGDSDGQAGNALAIVQKLRRGSETGKFVDSEPVRLITGVTAVKFEYLDGSAGATSWSASWSAQRRLPSAVRFTISVVRDGATYSSSGFARLDLANTPAQRSN